MRARPREAAGRVVRRQTRGVREQVRDGRALGPRLVVEGDRALLDRDERRVGDEQLRDRGERETRSVSPATLDDAGRVEHAPRRRSARRRWRSEVSAGMAIVVPKARDQTSRNCRTASDDPTMPMTDADDQHQHLGENELTRRQ